MSTSLDHQIRALHAERHAIQRAIRLGDATDSDHWRLEDVLVELDRLEAIESRPRREEHAKTMGQLDALQKRAVALVMSIGTDADDAREAGW